jgi:hypothetical protein
MTSRLALALLLCVGTSCRAQAVEPPPAHPTPAPAAERPEPNVRHIVVEDEGSRIEELRVRGQTVRLVVTPKVGTTKSYEIIQSRGGRAAEDSTGGANSALGKRVWNVLDF